MLCCWPVPWVLLRVAFPDTCNSSVQLQDPRLNCSSRSLFFQGSSPVWPQRLTDFVILGWCKQCQHGIRGSWWELTRCVISNCPHIVPTALLQCQAAPSQAKGGCWCGLHGANPGQLHTQGLAASEWSRRGAECQVLHFPQFVQVVPSLVLGSLSWVEELCFWSHLLGARGWEEETRAPELLWAVL